MKDHFPNPIVAELQRFAQDVMRESSIGEKEAQVLSLFYDERHKARKEMIPKFQIFGTLCDGKLEEGWYKIMTRAEDALGNLKAVGWVEVAQLSSVGRLASEKVGQAIETYRLTAKGLEVLQGLHPSVALQLRGFLAVMPPWLVLTGSIAGAGSAIWKIIELLLLVWR
jgi:hypothetical protein